MSLQLRQRILCRGCGTSNAQWPTGTEHSRQEAGVCFQNTSLDTGCCCFTHTAYRTMLVCMMRKRLQFSVVREGVMVAEVPRRQWVSGWTVTATRLLTKRNSARSDQSGRLSLPLSQNSDLTGYVRRAKRTSCRCLKKGNVRRRIRPSRWQGSSSWNSWVVALLVRPKCDCKP
jgi:hypothetical protein